MGAFDSDKFNGFARKSLDDFIFSDLWGLYIFNESDMHSAAYYYIRKYLSKKSRDSIFVRCEPMLAGMKPDIVVYADKKPIYVIELKMFTKPEYINEEAIFTDLDKLQTVINKIPTVKYAFFHMIYDAEEPYTLSDSRLRRMGYSKISVTTINARRRENSKRRRVGYDDWRKNFDKLVVRHKEFA